MAYRKLNAYSELRTKRESDVEAISDIGGTAGSSGVLFFFRRVARAPRLSNTMVRVCAKVIAIYEYTATVYGYGVGGVVDEYSTVRTG